MDNRDKINKIKEKVGKTSLYIGRIPEDTKTEFKELCKIEFEGDYGMCIKWLLDYRRGLLSSPNEENTYKIEVLAEQVVSLAQQIMELQNTPVEKKRTIRSVSGKTIAEKEETKCVN